MTIAPPPPGWAVREEDGEVEYVLCLFAPSAAEAETMSRAEADRHIVDFAGIIAAWIGSHLPDPYASSRARAEYSLARQHAREDDLFPGFERWLGEQILRMAHGKRPIPK